MGAKYREYNPGQRNTRERREIHPVWRGVGFVFMILIPIMSYAAAIVLMEQNAIYGWFPFPADMLAKPDEFLYKVFQDNQIYIKLLFTLAFAVVFFGIFTLLSFMITGMFGVSPKNDPFYVPPIKRQPRRGARRR